MINTNWTNFSLDQDIINGYLTNYEALAYLKKKRDELNNIAIVASGTAGLGFFGMPLLTIAGAAGTYVANELSIPLDRLISSMEMLLEEFKEEGITLIPRVKTGGKTIDLIVRTAEKNFALTLQSNGDSEISWNNAQQQFFTTQNGITLKWPELGKLAQELSKVKIESKIFSGEEFTKVVLLTSKTTLNPIDKAMMVDFGRAKALQVELASTLYVVDRLNIANFLRTKLVSTSA